MGRLLAVGAVVACAAESGAAGSDTAPVGPDTAPVGPDTDSLGSDTDSLGSDSAAPRALACDEAPLLGWANFGEGFLLDNCSACHAQTSPERHGAPDAAHFDTVADVRTWQAQIAARAAAPEGGMPPAGGVSDTDRALLGAWLRCDPALAPR